MKPADWIGLPQMKLPLLHAAAKCTVTSLLPLIAFARLRIGVCACDCNCADLRLLISNAHYPGAGWRGVGLETDYLYFNVNGWNFLFEGWCVSTIEKERLGPVPK